MMEWTIGVYEALIVIAAALGALCLFFLLMVCCLNPKCWINQVCPCAPKYDRFYSEDETKRKKNIPQIIEPLRRGGKTTKSTSLHSIKEVDNGHHEAYGSSGVSDEGMYDSIEEEQSEKCKEKLGLVSAKSRSMNHYLSFNSARTVPSSSGSQSASDESSSESSSPVYLPLRKSSVDFTLLWQRSSRLLLIDIHKLKCNFSKFAKVGSEVMLKVQLLKDATMLQNILSIFQREQDIQKNTVKEIQTSIRKRRKEIIFNEKFEMQLKDDTLLDYTVRLVICTVDSSNNTVESMGEVVTPVHNLESSTSYSTTMVLHPVPKEAVGEVLISLSYLPTCEKLSVAIMQINNVIGYTEGQSEFFVKMALVHRGKTLQRKKTGSQVADTHMTFNETEVFDLPLKYAERISLILSLKECMKGKWLKGEEYTRGKCVVSAHSEDVNAANHYKEMITNSRVPVVKWQFFR